MHEVVNQFHDSRKNQPFFQFSGSFANKHLDGFDEEHLVLYDRLINLPSNDWDIFYWATGAKETPEEFNNKVMDLLKEHTRNKDRESRIHLPHLKEKN